MTDQPTAPSLDDIGIPSLQKKEARPIFDPSKHLTLEVRYHEPTGLERVGEFVFRLHTAHDTMQMEAAQAAMTGGVPWGSISAHGQEVFRAVALCRVLLVAKPDWAMRPLDELQAELFVQLAREYHEHRLALFRVEGGDSEGGGEAKIRPVVEVVRRVGPGYPETA